jgi:hypothetical protein
MIPQPPFGFAPGNMLPPPPVGFPSGSVPLPPPPVGFPAGLIPPPPQGFPQDYFPPPPPGFLPQQMLAPPPGFFPRRQQSASVMQDPLSSIPHQTFQAHRANRTALPPHPSLPQNPNLTAHPPPPSARNPSTADVAAATVFAAPQLRDLKKEATAFMPSSLKRKKAGGSVGTSRINAAPSLEPSSGDLHAEPASWTCPA